MKILHTADWHIGQIFYQHDRADEHLHFFDQLCSIVEAEQPDALLVSGDVYHTSTPSNSSVKLYTDNMIRLHEACRTMQIVVIAGNHDSCSRLESTSEVWKLANVKVVGGIVHTDEGYDIEKHIIDINDKGFVIAIPDINERYNDIFIKAQQAVDIRNDKGLPVVMMGHLAVSGCKATGHDNIDMVIGGKITINTSDIVTPTCDYFALGHIHHPQTLAGQTTARYSGSALHINFDERFPHTVSIVTIDKHGTPPVINEVTIHQKRHCYIVPEEPLPFTEALNKLRDFNPKEDGYLRLDVIVENYLPSDAVERVQRIISEKTNAKLKLCLINPIAKQSDTYIERHNFSVSDLRHMGQQGVFEVAMNYCQEKKTPLDEEQQNELKELITEVMKEQVNN